MTPKNHPAPLLCYFKLFASFRSYWWIQTRVTVRKRQIWVKFDNCFSRVTLKFDWWPWKTIGHPFYPISSFVYHFIPIGEFKLELQSGNTLFGSKSTIFFNRVTFKLDRWPWKTIGHLFMLLQALCIISYPLVNSNWSYSPETPDLGQNQQFFELCDLQAWRMTLKNNRAPLLWYIMLCASYQCHW